MKKLLLSLVLIFSLAGYSLFTRKNQTPGQITGLSPSPPASSPPVNYKDGTYTGDVADAYYGNVQVKAIIGKGKITDVQFLQYPNDRETSIEINSQAMPLLRSEAIQAQKAEVDVVTGATATSQAFVESLSSALVKAQ
jgi:uncharacterized protein with FMN-binding domain